MSLLSCRLLRLALARGRIGERRGKSGDRRRVAGVLPAGGGAACPPGAACARVRVSGVAGSRDGYRTPRGRHRARRGTRPRPPPEEMPRNNPGHDIRSTGADGRMVWMQFEADRRGAQTSGGGARGRTVAPMTPDELRERIARGEDPHTDFKRTVDRNADLARDLVCFANSDGGQLIIGVADDRTVVGVQDVDALMLRVDDVAFNLCSPPVTAVPETVPFDGHDVVVLNVAKGDQRPYSTRDGRYYIRAGARCRQASREELLRLFQAAQSLFYDEQPLPRLSIKDLDLLDVARYLASTQQQDLDDDLPRLLRAWRLYDGAHPTAGGVVLFGRAAQAVLESARMVVGAVAGADIGTDFIDRK